MLWVKKAQTRNVHSILYSCHTEVSDRCLTYRWGKYNGGGIHTSVAKYKYNTLHELCADVTVTFSVCHHRYLTGPARHSPCTDHFPPGCLKLSCSVAAGWEENAVHHHKDWGRHWRGCEAVRLAMLELFRSQSAFGSRKRNSRTTWAGNSLLQGQQAEQQLAQFRVVVVVFLFINFENAAKH